MKWLNKLERKYGRYAIHELMKYIVGANLIVYFFNILIPGFYLNLVLNPRLVMSGEIWRGITFIFIPSKFNPIWLFFQLYLYYSIGMALENIWGSFKFNVYYFTGVVLTVAISLITNTVGTSNYLNLTLFLAFATIYPNYELLLFMVLPVKMKYFALLYVLLLVQSIIMGGFPAFIMITVSLANYLIFFWNDFLNLINVKKATRRGKKKFKVIEMKNYYRHRCCVCGITEKDDPDMEFRYCSKCSGHKEYCMNHLRNHEHTSN